MSRNAGSNDVPIEVLFYLAAYSVDCVQRAAYRLDAEASSVVRVSGSSVVWQMYPRDSVDVAGLKHAARQLALDEALRERIRADTEPVRNAILALAFSRTGLIDQHEREIPDSQAAGARTETADSEDSSGGDMA